MRIGLVVNAASGGSDSGGDSERLLRAAGAEIEIVALEELCDGPGGVDEERLGAVVDGASGYDRIAVAGGDGSLGPAGLLALRCGLPLAVIPVGTANSFARFHDLPLDLDDACRVAADPAAATTGTEIADANGRPFVNVAAAGLSVLAANRAQPLKRVLGPLSYAAGALHAAATGSPLRCEIRADGEEAWSGDAWQVLVAATGAFGGESSTGGVDPDDHRLDVAVVPSGPRLALARRALAMRQGRLVDEDAVHHVRGKVVEVDAEGDPSFNVDGEILELQHPRFRVLGRVEVVTG